MREKKSVLLRLDPQAHAALKTYAALKGKSMQEVFEESILATVACTATSAIHEDQQIRAQESTPAWRVANAVQMADKPLEARELQRKIDITSAELDVIVEENEMLRYTYVPENNAVHVSIEGERDIVHTTIMQERKMANAQSTS